MSPLRLFMVAFLVSFSLVALISPAAAQEPLKPTLEWLYSSEAQQIVATPMVRWLSDGRAVLYDSCKPAAERTLEVVDPVTGRRTPMLDASVALTNLKALMGEEKAPKILPFPQEIDGIGRTALYILGGDVVLFDIPSETFARATETPGEESCAHLSPDGKKVAYVRGNNLFLYDIASRRERQLTSDGSDSVRNGSLTWVYWEEVFGRNDVAYWWSPDSRSIAFLRTDESGVSIQHYLDFKPWTPRLITQRYPKVGQQNPRVTVGVIHVEEPKAVWIDLRNYPYEYIVRVNWLPDSRALAVQTMNRLQTEKHLLFADPGSGNVRHLLTETDSGWVNIDDDLLFLRDGKSFIWSSERDGYKHLYRYSLNGTLMNPVTQGKWATFSGGGGVAWVQRSIVGIDEESGWLYFTALEKSSIERHLYRVGLDGIGMKRISEEEGTHSITCSPNGKFYFDRFSNAASPPSMTLRRSDGSVTARLTEPAVQQISARGIHAPSFFSIPARDGFPLPAQILKPLDFDPAIRYPIIFYVYGGPSAPTVVNTWQRDMIWENILADNGYLVAHVDPRSATGISKDLENLIVGKEMGDVELNDLVDAVRWMKRQPYVDSARCGIWGWSGGGSYTMLGMTRSTEFAAGIAVAGVSDFRFYDTKWGEAAMKTEAENKEGFDSVSLLRYAKDLHGRLMIVHGTFDDNVHIQNAWAFMDELIKVGKLFEVMVYPMRQHGISDRPARVHLYKTMLDFWKRNL